jgi:hypothetical protein
MGTTVISITLDLEYFHPVKHIESSTFIEEKPCGRAMLPFANLVNSILYICQK